MNGASVNSPPQERLDASLGVLANAIRTAPTGVDAAMRNFSADLGERSPLQFAIADLLSAAAPGNEIANELVQKLTAPAAIEMAARCMALFAAGDGALEPSETGGAIGGWNFTCGVIAPIATEEAGRKSLERYGAAPTKRTLAISVGWSANIRSALFVSSDIKTYEGRH